MSANDPSEEVMQMIYDTFAATSGGNHNALYNDVSGRFYWHAAPQSPAPTRPYLVCKKVTGTPFFHFNNKSEELLFQFDIHTEGSSPKTAQQILQDLVLLFEWQQAAVTSMTNWYCIFIAPDPGDIGLRTEETETAEGGWAQSYQYRIRVQQK